MKAERVFLLLASLAGLLWLAPFAWMAVASMRPDAPGQADLASLWPSGPFGWDNYRDAWDSGHFPLWYLNTALLCLGILTVQMVTVSLAGYAFARIDFPGRSTVFALFLMQLLLPPAVLVVPNLQMIVHLGLFDSLAGIAAPYCASAFGVFLMRQTFRSIPRDFEEAARIDGASRLQIMRHILLPMAWPGLASFAVVSVSAHWNEFLWPLLAVSSPQHQVLTVGLASFTLASESGGSWGVIAAGTALVALPLLLGFTLLQRRFTASLASTGLK